MWKTKELKRNARAALRANYWRCIIVCLLILALAGGLNFPRPEETMNSLGSLTELSQLNYKATTHTQIVNEVARGMFGQSLDIWTEVGQVSRAQNGALASIFNNATASGSFIFGLLNAVNQLFFKDGIWPAVIIGIGAIFTFAYYLFVKNILQVGKYRFYLENRRYSESHVNRLLYVYQIRRTRKVALVMFLRALYTVLWSLTLVGGVIKYYSYRMVPLIVAENPDISPKDALRLSRSMMAGNKWACFLFDASFFGWFLLSFLSARILGILYITPYYTAANAELYMELRARLLESNPALAAPLYDSMLATGASVKAEYPCDACSTPTALVRQWITVDYHRHYSFRNIILLFFAFCFIGYAWEVLYYLVETGRFINRGTLYGPWLPIYGCGGIAVILLLRRFIDRPVLTFFLVIGLCGTIEYITSWILETLKHVKWWDYTGYFLNINGRVCLEGLLVFGIAGTVGIYLMAPSLDALFCRIPKKVSTVLCIVLLAAFACDFVISFIHPNMAAGVAV